MFCPQECIIYHHQLPYYFSVSRIDSNRCAEVSISALSRNVTPDEWKGKPVFGNIGGNKEVQIGYVKDVILNSNADQAIVYFYSVTTTTQICATQEDLALDAYLEKASRFGLNFGPRTQCSSPISIQRAKNWVDLATTIEPMSSIGLAPMSWCSIS